MPRKHQALKASDATTRSDRADEIKVYEAFNRINWDLGLRYDGRIRANADPLEALDILGAQDFEGHSKITHLLQMYPDAVLVSALATFLMFNEATPAFRTKCASAINTVQRERTEREWMVRTLNRGECEVWCIFCKDNLYSDYHAEWCDGPPSLDDTKSETIKYDYDAIIAGALQSDDPETFLEHFAF